MAQENKYDEILNLISLLEKSEHLPPSILVWKGVSIQLSSGKTAVNLNDAELAFRMAVDIDSRCVEAILELAWFLYAVRDDAIEAVALFEQALAISRQQAADSVIGVIQCLLEMEGRQHALRYLKESLNPIYSSEDACKLAKLKHEIEMNANGK
ncbi:MAG: hypothetical protein ABFD64_09785 [Armatimonadota bacterium]